jgi:putative acetyltransferase
MSFSIRNIEQQDNPVLAQIIRSAFHDFNAPQAGTVYVDPTTDQLFELFRQPGSVCWVAETENGVAGCCGGFPTPELPTGYAELVKFYLLKTERGKGIGKALMEKCIDSARQLGYTKLYLESLPEFGKAVRIYEKLGFKTIDHPMGQSGHPGCNIWMLKEL